MGHSCPHYHIVPTVTDHTLHWTYILTGTDCTFDLGTKATLLPELPLGAIFLQW